MPLKGKKRKLSRILFSFIVSILVTLIVQWNTITSVVAPIVFPKSVLYLNLQDMEVSYTEQTLNFLIQHNRYVPNYDAEVFIQFYKDKLELGDDVQVRISILDKGIVPLQKPYFYAFLLSPSNKIVLSFPSLSYVSSGSKMSAWETGDYQDFYTDCLKVESDGKDYYIPRKTLIEGSGNFVYAEAGFLHWSRPSEVVLQYRIKEDTTLIGTWKVYVFLYDQIYYDRFGEKIETSNYNFVQHSSSEFQVTAKGQRIEDIFNKYILIPTVFGITFALNYIGIYPEIEKQEEKLIKIWKKLKEHWLFIAIIMIILVIQLLLYLISV